MIVRVQAAPFDPGAEANAFAAGLTQAGAVVTFTGLVRDNGGALHAMEIEHYPGMTETAIRGMVDSLAARLGEGGGTLAEWSRLIRSQSVLADRPAALKSLATARERLAADPDALAALAALAGELGLQEASR